jgi:hypothetical protein
MADLSPAQRIIAAFNERHELCGPFDDDWVEQCLAAAFRAAADQVVPTQADRDAVPEFHAQCVMNGIAYAANELRLIAAELETTTNDTL